MKRRGNKIVTTKAEHPAVLECCKALEAEGFEVVYTDVDRNCRLDTEQIKNAIDDRTILVSVMHVNNETGTIMPVSGIKDIMREKGCMGLLHCDAVQSFGKLPMPAEADLISISGHKIHGPKGIGVLYIKKGVNLPAYILGGGQENGRRSGTENVPAIAGFGLAAEMSYKTRREDMLRIAETRQALIKGLTDSLDDILINSPEDMGEEAGMCCPAVLSVSFLGTRGEVLLHTLEQDGIYVSTGSACSSNKKGKSHVLSAMGLKPGEIEGTVRFSFGRFNSPGEMEFTAEKVTAAVRKFRRLGSFR